MKKAAQLSGLFCGAVGRLGFGLACFKLWSKRSCWARCCGVADIDGMQAFWPLHYIETDRLARFKGLVAVHLDG
jgi:hypothetical protein